MTCNGCEKEMKSVNRECLGDNRVEEAFVCACGRNCVTRTGTNETWGNKDEPVAVGTPNSKAAIACGKAPKSGKSAGKKKPAQGARRKKSTKSAARKKTRKK